MDDILKLFYFFIIMTVFEQSSPNQKESTLPIEDRVKLLKYQIKEQIHSKRNRHHKRPMQEEESIQPLKNEHYDYVDLDSLPITPIMDFDDRKKDEKFKLRQLMTTTTQAPKILPPPENTPESPIIVNIPMRSGKRVPQFEKSVDSFYRRVFSKHSRDTPLQWAHCQDMIKPYVTGVKTELTEPLIVHDRSVARFMQLLSENITTYSKEEIYSHLYQISNLNIRLFQWNVTNIITLLSVITKGKLHTFRSVKNGIRELFNTWHLDYSNATNLLLQSRIFRPPCLEAEQGGGSTKSSGASRYSKLTTPALKRICDEKIEDDFDCVSYV